MTTPNAMKYLLLLIFPSVVIAQQDPLIGMYWNQYALINPATSGLENKTDAYATYRNQWNKVNGAPKSIFANYNMRLADRHGLGANYIYDKIGFTNAQTANINYNYQLRFKNESRLSLGLAAGVYVSSISGDWIPPTTSNDPSLPGGRSYAPNFNAGIAYLTKRLFIGVGSTSLDNYKLGNNYKKKTHSYLHGRYIFDLGERTRLYSECIIQTDWTKVSMQMNVRALLFEQIWIGAGFRTSDAITGMVSWDIAKKFRVGYQYEYIINKLSNITNGSHEAVLGFYLK